MQHGPVDMASEATAEQFREALSSAFTDEDVDSVVVCFIPPLVTLDEAVVRALAEGGLRLAGYAPERFKSTARLVSARAKCSR